jgi:hypothetical protein
LEGDRKTSDRQRPTDESTAATEVGMA